MACEPLLPSICGGRMIPTMTFVDECDGCIPRPYLTCSNELLIPNVCDIGCEEQTEDVDNANDSNS